MQAFEISSVGGGVEAVEATGREIAVAVAEGVDQRIPLNLLTLSEFNVRKTRNPQSIPELAALIEAETLLYPLCVVPELKKAKATGRFGVVAGGRRLEALQFLAEQGRMALDAPIACKVFDSARAVGVSLTENVTQEAMHAADTVEAFKALVVEGKSIGEIAGRFGVSELTVERRLKLANLAPMFLQLWRDGQLDPKQLQALALTDDHAKQIAAWQSLPSYNRSAYLLREALTQEEVPLKSNLASFVGLEAYEQAGGAVRRDLFGKADDVFLCDAQLVQKLADAALEVAAAAARAEGWKWVEVRTQFGYSEQGRFTRIYAKTSKPSDEEAEGLAEVDSMLKAVREELHAIERKGNSRDLTEAEDALRDDLEELIGNLGEFREAVEATLKRWTPGQLAMAGVVITIDGQGSLSVHEGLVRAEDRKAEKGAGDAESAPVKVKAAFSERLMKSMTAHRTAAVSAALTDNPHVAMVALLHRLVQSEKHSYEATPVRVNFTASIYSVQQNAADFDQSQAAVVVNVAQERWGEKLPDDSGALFRYLLAQDAGTLAELLALHVARSYDVIRGREESHRGFNVEEAIEGALGLDMADWWTPSAATYLDSVPKAKMIEAVTEACGEAEARDMAKMKKAEAIAAAAAKLDGKRWLPAPLRRAASANTTGTE